MPAPRNVGMAPRGRREFMVLETDVLAFSEEATSPLPLRIASVLTEPRPYASV